MKSTDTTLREATPFDAWPEQVEFFAWLMERTRRRQEALVPKSREIGVTWGMLHLLSWEFLFHEIGGIVGSRTQQAVDRLHDPGSLFGKLRFLMDRQPPHIRPRRLWMKLLLIANLDTGNAIRGQSTAKDFARSERELIILLDEPGAIDARRMRSILTSTESAGGSMWLPYQPPEGPGHPLEDLFRELDPERVRLMDWKTDPYRTAEFPTTKIRPRGRLTQEQFDREYGGKHGTAPEGAVWAVPAYAYYDEEDPEWSAIAARVRQVAPCIPGMDFGSGPSSSACPVVLYDNSTSRLRVWIDDYREWKRTAYPTVAADILAMIEGSSFVAEGDRLHSAVAWEMSQRMRRGKLPPGMHRGNPADAAYGDGRFRYREPYTGTLAIYGDPAGRAKDSGGVSWDVNLRNEGLPLVCLDSTFNEATIQRITIQEINDGLIEGWIRIHRRCEASLGAAMRSWLWDTPAGQRPEEVNRAVVLPRKDWPSHACNALCYSFMGAKLELNRQKGGSAPQTRGRGARQTVNDFMRKGRF